MWLSSISNSGNFTGAAIAATAQTLSLSRCAPDRKVEAIINASLEKEDDGIAGKELMIRFSDLAIADTAPTINNSQLFFVRTTVDDSGSVCNTFRVVTNVSRQIRWRANVVGTSAATSDELNIACLGWRKV
jgi:hypothetical protein